MAGNLPGTSPGINQLQQRYPKHKRPHTHTHTYVYIYIYQTENVAKESTTLPLSQHTNWGTWNPGPKLRRDWVTSSKL